MLQDMMPPELSDRNQSSVNFPRMPPDFKEMARKLVTHHHIVNHNYNDKKNDLILVYKTTNHYICIITKSLLFPRR